MENKKNQQNQTHSKQAHPIQAKTPAKSAGAKKEKLDAKSGHTANSRTEKKA